MRKMSSHVKVALKTMFWRCAVSGDLWNLNTFVSLRMCSALSALTWVKDIQCTWLQRKWWHYRECQMEVVNNTELVMLLCKRGYWRLKLNKHTWERQVEGDRKCKCLYECENQDKIGKSRRFLLGVELFFVCYRRSHLTWKDHGYHYDSSYLTYCMDIRWR
jgi:hypothetical protein